MLVKYGPSKCPEVLKFYQSEAYTSLFEFFPLKSMEREVGSSL